MKTTILKEWTNPQFKNAEKIIVKWINSRFFETHHSQGATPFCNAKTFSAISSILGLAYTSSSQFAGYWVCNTELYLDAAKKYEISGFVQDKSGFVYAYCADKKENELLIPLN